MSYIIERLFLGDIDDAYKTSLLKEQNGVTHILTVDSKPLSMDVREGFVYLHIHALDMENFDLLSHFESAIQFIDSGRNQGSAILVHCWAGQSRSAAVVIAYIMKMLSLTVEEAEELVRAQRPIVKPNSGFITQLNLFQEMNYTVDSVNPAYRKYRLELLASQMQKDYDTVEAQCNRNMNVTAVSTRVERNLPNCPGGQMSRVTLNNQMPVECMAIDPSTLPLQSQDDTIYRCAKCRRPLFRQSGVLCHDPHTSSSQFKGHRGPNAKKSAFPDGGSVCDVFIEPVTWMANAILSIEGKLTCPKCHAKIGSFNWAGERCPCGSWVTPAFHVQKSKVDACPAVVAPFTGIRCPASIPPTSRSVVEQHSTSSSRSSTVDQQPCELTVLSSPDGNQLLPASEHRAD